MHRYDRPALPALPALGDDVRAPLPNDDTAVLAARQELEQSSWRHPPSLLDGTCVSSSRKHPGHCLREVQGDGFADALEDPPLGGGGLGELLEGDSGAGDATGLLTSRVSGGWSSSTTGVKPTLQESATRSAEIDSAMPSARDAAPLMWVYS